MSFGIISPPVGANRLFVTLRGAGVSEASSAIYIPSSRRGRILKAGMIALAKVGARRHFNAPQQLHDGTMLLASTFGSIRSFFGMTSSREGRWILGLSAGSAELVAKVGAPSDEGVRREALFLATQAGELREYAVPNLMAEDFTDHYTLLATERYEVRGPCGPHEAVRACIVLGRENITHGDFTPWNFVLTERGPMILDWETVQPFLPGFDYIHWEVKLASLVSRTPAPELASRLLAADGNLSQVLAATALNVTTREAVLRYLSHEHSGDQSVRAITYRESLRVALT